MLLFAAVADHTADDIQTGRYGRVGDDAGVPDGVDQLILTDHTLHIADQIVKKVEDLGRNGDDGPAPPQLAAISVERTVFKEITQAGVPT